jgi:hypothetical protein
MIAIRSPEKTGIAITARARIAAVVFAIISVAVSVDVPAQEPITAVYKAREIDFFFRSNNHNYPCHELRNQVANILRAVGARDDIDVKVNDCEMVPQGRYERDMDADRWDPLGTPADPFRNRRRERAQTAHVRVRLMSPVELTPEVLAEIDKDRSRRELVSRVTGNPAAAMNDPVVFAAQRQPVTLSRRSVRLEPEDCELLEQMATSVFRELDIRVVRRSFTCDPRQVSRITPQLTVEALLPTGALMPMPDPEKRAPATSESKQEDSAPQPAPE